MLVDDSRGPEAPLRIIVEIKGHHGDLLDPRSKQARPLWERWAFAEFTEVYTIQSDFEARIKAEFGTMIDKKENSLPSLCLCGEKIRHGQRMIVIDYRETEYMDR